MGREARTYNKLTKKQNKFVSELASGKSATQSVLDTYNTANPKTAAVIASENLNKPNIKEALEEALKRNGLELDSVLKNIKSLADSEPVRVSGDVKLKSNVEILKLFGAYPGNKKNQTTVSVKVDINSMSYSEAKQELERINVITGEIINDVEG